MSDDSNSSSNMSDDSNSSSNMSDDSNSSVKEEVFEAEVEDKKEPEV